MSGRLIGIARRRAARAPMETLMTAAVTPETGVADDYRGRVRPGRIPRRQVSILRVEDWQGAEADLGTALPWTMRRANLLVSGITLPQRAGYRLHIGMIVLEVTGECDPCRRMDEQHPGLWPALIPEWRGGVLARVVTGGAIALGDEVVHHEVRMDAV
ncbi:MOSC domain-containing protein [Sphingomonas solaris]|uniref:MOSC domain-containing protein n=1 Tax=Alterirhizorhabdus solaris TaxID=2529389 RepID=A0A558R1L9_9SPHN|nr:MOSC domain-containing protein [Sphingomonas solaris]TVV73270.1 MOSC domain-containing protein [Sphingomonas solaris]